MLGLKIYLIKVLLLDIFIFLSDAVLEAAYIFGFNFLSDCLPIINLCFGFLFANIFLFSSWLHKGEII